jgi:carbamoyl-phosphate synthase large subunit
MESPQMMSDRTDTILLIGSGPIQIGQAAEFDYSGAQACRALREEGARVVLVNSNPATIMTDPEMADKVYIEPITPAVIEEIIEIEQPDGVIAGLGGQTGLNVTAALAEEGVLERHDVAILGTPLDTIYATEDRELFRHRMQALGQPVPASTTIELPAGTTVGGLETAALEGLVDEAVEAVGGLPVIARTTYTLGGAGSGVVDSMEELYTRVRQGLRLSRNNEVLITESIAGWIELEYEVMRDAGDSCIIICNMENIDPMGIHTGESIHAGCGAGSDPGSGHRGGMQHPVRLAGRRQSRRGVPRGGGQPPRLPLVRTRIEGDRVPDRPGDREGGDGQAAP